jgi:hypothetical protein
MKKKLKKCFNCKHAGAQFKLGGLTHLHCEHPKNDEAFKRGEITSPYDTLQEFCNTCEDHEEKEAEK